MIIPEWLSHYQENEPKIEWYSISPGWVEVLNTIYSNLESYEFIQSCYKEKYEREISSTDAKNISFVIKHSNSFFVEATEAPFDIKPTIIFYACLQLARAAILFNSWAKEKAETLSPSHGMKFLHRPSDGGINPLKAFKIKLEKSGTLPSFYFRTIGKNYILSHPTSMHFQTYSFGKEFVEKSFPEIDIMNLIGLLPDVSIDIPLSEARLIKCTPSYQWSNKFDNWWHYLFVNANDVPVNKVEEWLSYLKEAGYTFEVVREKDHYQIKSLDRSMPVTVYRDLDGDYFFPWSISGKLVIPEEVIFLMLIFGISNLARYYPEQWRKISNSSEKYGLYFSLMKKILNVILVKYRILMLPRFMPYIPRFYLPSSLLAGSPAMPPF